LIDNFRKTDRERSGVVNKNVNQNTLSLSSKVAQLGNDDSVVIDDLRKPSIHNHPLDSSGCARINGDCGLQPPSSSDMKVYAESPAFHTVATKNYIYHIKRTRRLNKRQVERCYKILEKHYDELVEPHEVWEEIWICFTKMTGWFYVIRCKNANCNHKVDPYLIEKMFLET
tara:strand:+ start:437 stop:949 length:513 start_codon:yes stop_codon:yes gene_type:complete